MLGAYLAGVGLNAITPARSGDVLKLYLVKHRVEGSTYPTLAATLVVETLFDAAVGIALLAWAVYLGVLPNIHQPAGLAEHRPALPGCRQIGPPLLDQCASLMSRVALICPDSGTFLLSASRHVERDELLLPVALRDHPAGQPGALVRRSDVPLRRVEVVVLGQVPRSFPVRTSSSTSLATTLVGTSTPGRRRSRRSPPTARSAVVDADGAGRQMGDLVGEHHPPAQRTEGAPGGRVDHDAVAPAQPGLEGAGGHGRDLLRPLPSLPISAAMSALRGNTTTGWRDHASRRPRRR